MATTGRERRRMNELIYVVKCLFITVALVLVAQIKVKEKTIESHITEFGQRSWLAKNIQQTAAGGARAAGEIGTTVKRSFSSTRDKSKEQKAQR